MSPAPISALDRLNTLDLLALHTLTLGCLMTLTFLYVGWRAASPGLAMLLLLAAATLLLSDAYLYECRARGRNAPPLPPRAGVLLSYLLPALLFPMLSAGLALQAQPCPAGSHTQSCR